MHKTDQRPVNSKIIDKATDNVVGNKLYRFLEKMVRGLINSLRTNPAESERVAPNLDSIVNTIL